jgi:hypothetical protein
MRDTKEESLTTSSFYFFLYMCAVCIRRIDIYNRRANIYNTKSAFVYSGSIKRGPFYILGYNIFCFVSTINIGSLSQPFDAAGTVQRPPEYIYISNITQQTNLYLL